MSELVAHLPTGRKPCRNLHTSEVLWPCGAGVLRVHAGGGAGDVRAGRAPARQGSKPCATLTHPSHAAQVCYEYMPEAGLEMYELVAHLPDKAPNPVPP